MAEAIVESSVRGTGEGARVWGAAGITSGESQRHSNGRQAPLRPATISAWLTAEDVALLILRGECAEAGISVPARFSPQALVSAVSSVERWTREGRIFAVHGLYPRYQFDNRGRPHASVERVLSVLGRGEPLRVGNWFATPNPYLGGKRPQELLTNAPAFVILALLKSVQHVATL